MTPLQARTGRQAANALAALLLLAAASGVPPASAADIVGRASVIDGDTIEIHSQRIRLSGIDAPESDQFCRGADSLPYRCGAKTANALDAFIAGRPVRCRPVSRDRYGRIVAACSVDGQDIAEWLVANGLALDWPQYSYGRYDSLQREAERAGRGLWAGSFEQPWRYRACLRGGASPTACADDANAHP